MQDRSEPVNEISSIGLSTGYRMNAASARTPHYLPSMQPISMGSGYKAA